MKNLIIIFTIIFGLTVSCKSTKSFPTTFYEIYSNNPELTIDSINKVDTLQFLQNYKNQWNKSMYITSDSVITTQYTAVTSRKDTTYIMSVIVVDGDTTYLIKYRKE